ncbi:hypothetical protein T4B_11364 [Trichinella pseudospiralis]|uniref:Uncharacterized protein n=1 Tax=Trichinella pseudospiralis TaxID=6337 RepID=A0A0V1DJ97_TRIPS|nr:hypothetical protein T4A_12706 [Trichinella pseudospiralis]KRY96171.1 hypothetical protein T4B_11364 [Trichinella pseudospiralis]
MRFSVSSKFHQSINIGSLKRFAKLHRKLRPACAINGIQNCRSAYLNTQGSSPPETLLKRNHNR